MKAYFPYQPTIIIALVLTVILSYYSFTYTTEQIDVDSVEIELNEKKIDSIDGIFCQTLPEYNFEKGITYDGELISDIQRKANKTKFEKKYQKKRYKVILRIYVDSTGTLYDSEVIFSSGEKEIDQEADRIINSLSKWEPGIVNGKPATFSMSIPVVFDFSDKKD